ncbi:MAG TPA: hypothetical protein VGO09_02400 [Flavisolibacter sp.]|nr:hypothetical protein [Flavisolibacter sp.]
MDSNTLQQKFFLEIKSQIPPNLSLVDEIAEVLNISNDSSYRRIRGEKTIDFTDLKKLALHYKISIDQFFHLETESILFTDRSVTANNSFHFDMFLKALENDLTYINSFDHRKMYYLNKDIPIFHYFNFHELAAFKCFFWMKSIVHDPTLSRESFDLKKYVPLISESANKIKALYMQIPSCEIWNIESINSTIRQIDYYRNTEGFKNKEDIEIIYNCLERTIDQIEAYAEIGEKKLIMNNLSKGADYQLYINEFILGDNTIYVELNDNGLVYINHGVINYMVTKDPKFCCFTKDNFQNIIKRSTLISSINEKDRIRFFKQMREKIRSRMPVIK